jgi:membrane protein
VAVSPSPAPAESSRSRWTALRESPGLLVRSARAARDDDLPVLASAVAYNAFLAIPATLLLVVGLFSLVAQPDLIGDLMERFGTVVPEEAVVLVEDSLLQLEQQPSAGIAMTVVGFVLALWTTTGSMATFMLAINRAHDLEDSRGFAQKRLAAVVLVGALGVAVVTVAVFLVLGPHVERWLGDALGAESAVSWVWWTVRWPLLLLVLFGAFSVFYALAIERGNRRWRVLSPGALVAVLLWIAVSAGFGLYTANFGAYNKTWGSLSAAIVTLVWLWLSALALLFGAEVDAEADRVARGASRDVNDDAGRSRASPAHRAA